MLAPASAQVPHTIRPIANCFGLHRRSVLNLDRCEFSVLALGFFAKSMDVQCRFKTALRLCRSQMARDWKEDDSFHSWCARIQQWCTIRWPCEKKVGCSECCITKLPQNGKMLPCESIIFNLWCSKFCILSSHVSEELSIVRDRC